MRWIKVPDYFSGGACMLIRRLFPVFRISLAIALLVIVGRSSWAQAPAAPATGQKSLYERLGGLKGITLVVDDFIDRLVNNATLNKNKAIDAGRKASPPPYLKFQVSELVCEATGGPCKYTGKNMKDAHAHLHITETEWKIMAADFKKSLDKFKVPQTEQKELFDIVGKTKADIVTVDDTEASEKKPKK
jgi:hemoglobin